jgi:hypothetical protein
VENPWNLFAGCSAFWSGDIILAVPSPDSSGGESMKAPVPSELGFDVTIALAAITKPDGYVTL